MNWNNISIKQYRELERVISSYDLLDRSVGILSVINDKSEDYYYDMKIDKLIKEINKLDFLNEPPKGEIKHNITLDDTEYKLDSNIHKWTAGRYIDYMNTITDSPDNFGLLMAILYTPKGKKYGEGYDVLELVNKFEELCPITYVLGVSSFFLTLLQSLTKATLSSLKKDLKKMKDPKKRKEIEDQINLISGLV